MTAGSPDQAVVARTTSNVEETEDAPSFICNTCKARIMGTGNCCRACMVRHEANTRTAARQRMTALVDRVNVADLATLIDCLDSRFQGDFAFWSDIPSREVKNTILSMSSSFMKMVSGGDAALLQEMVSGQHSKSYAADDEHAILDVGEARDKGDSRVTVDLPDSESSSERDDDVADPYARTLPDDVHNQDYAHSQDDVHSQDEEEDATVDPYDYGLSRGLCIAGAIEMDEDCFARCFRASCDDDIAGWCRSTKQDKEWCERTKEIRLPDGESAWLRVNGADSIVYGCTLAKRRNIGLKPNEQSTGRFKRKGGAGNMRQYKYSEVQKMKWVSQVHIPSKGFPSQLMWMGYTVNVCAGQVNDAGIIVRQDRVLLGVIQADTACHKGENTLEVEGTGAIYNVFGPLENHGRFVDFVDGVCARGCLQTDIAQHVMNIIGHVRHFSCHKSAPSSCGLCLKEYDEGTEQCFQCKSSFCTGCAKGWVRAVGNVCPYCKAYFKVADRIVCVTCSHATLRALFELLHPEKPAVLAFTRASGCHVHGQRTAGHAKCDMHRFTEPRHAWIRGCDINVEMGLQFKKELEQNTNELNRRGVQSAFRSLDMFRTDLEEEKEQAQEQQGVETEHDALAELANVSPAMVDVTARMLHVVFSYTKAMKPPSEVKRFYETMRLVYGTYLGKDMPGTHAAVENPEKSVRKMTRVISYGLHVQMIKKMKARVNTIYDSHGHVEHLHDPCKYVCDVYSAGARSWFPMLVKTFHTSCPETAEFKLLACPDSYANFNTFAGEVQPRDTTASGLFNTWKHVVTHAHFPNITLDKNHPLCEPILGWRHFTESCVEISGDQGGGMPNCLAELAKKIPDLPDTRGESHLIMTLINQARKAQDPVSVCTNSYFLITELAKKMQKPKRNAFAARVCENVGLQWAKLPVYVENRWAPSARDVFAALLVQLQNIAYVLLCMLDTAMYTLQKDEFGLLVNHFAKAVVNYETLLWFHQWFDILDTISIAIKNSEPGTASILTQYANRVELQSRLHDLADEQKCPALQRYRSGLQRKDDKVYAQYLKRDIVSGKTMPVWVRLGTVADIEDVDDTFTNDRMVLLADLIARVDREMPVTEEMTAYNTLYNPGVLEFEEMKKNRDIFVQSFRTIVTQYKRRLPAWVTNRFVVEQAQAFRDLLMSQRSEFEHTARSETHMTFWLAVRNMANSKGSNITLVLYFRKVGLARGGQEAPAEQLISVLHVFGDDAQRQTLSGSHVEDLIRCSYNGPSVHSFNPNDFIECYFAAFEMRPVRTVEQVATGLTENAVTLAGRRRRYATNPVLRQKIKGKARARYGAGVKILKHGRGELSTRVRPCFTKLRGKLRGKTVAKRPHPEREDWVDSDLTESSSAHEMGSSDEIFEEPVDERSAVNFAKSISSAKLPVSPAQEPKRRKRKRFIVSSDSSVDEENILVKPVDHLMESVDKEREVLQVREAGEVLVCAGETGVGCDDVPWIAVVVARAQTDDDTDHATVPVRWLEPRTQGDYVGPWVNVRGRPGLAMIPEASVLGIIVWDCQGDRRGRVMGESNWAQATEWYQAEQARPDTG